MIIFAYEFVTGGGMAERPLPEALAYEADLMLRALTDELRRVPGVRVRIGRDRRMPPLEGVDSLQPEPGEAPLAFYRRGLAGADAAWPTAPETGGILEQLAAETLAAGVPLLGCLPAAIRLAAGKRETARRLAAAGIPVVPTFGRGDAIPPIPGDWVIKPDDGAGAEGVRILPSWREAERELTLGPDLVVQPWLAGEAASLSLLCSGGSTVVLALNRQRIGVEAGRLRLAGLEVNVPRTAPVELTELATAVAAAVPQLQGYVGVDLVLTAAGPVVLELNPRLTTSYCALGRALDVNVAGLIVANLLQGRPLPEMVAPRGRPVTLDLAPAHV